MVDRGKGNMEIQANDSPNQKQLVADGQKKANTMLKHQAELSALTDCLSQLGHQFNSFAYRVVHGALNHPDNYLPQAVLKPARLNSTPHLCCSLWGLSMFETRDQLARRMKKNVKNSPNFLKLVGDHYVCLSLKSSHGLRTPSSKHGHFDFYPYTDCDVNSAVIEHAPLTL